MSPRTADDDEEVTKRVFLQLDPNLRLLLAVQQNLQHQLSSVSRSDDRTGIAAQQDADRQVLASLQVQHNCLRNLEQSLALLRDEIPKDQLSKSLEVVLKYLSLPLLVAMKHAIPMLDWNLARETTESFLLRRSALWKCVEQAADLWVDLCQLILEAKAHELLWLQAIATCAAALPSGQTVADNQRPENSSTLLDRGESCLQALLGAILKLVAFCSPQTIVNGMEGALTARIADTCMAILTPPPPSTDRPSTAISFRSSPVPRPLPDELQFTANQTLLAMIRAVPLPRVWQRAFPGCFAGLYRNLLLHLRIRKGASSPSSVAVSSLQSLTALLQVALSLPCAERESSAASLQQLAQQANEVWHHRQSASEKDRPSSVSATPDPVGEETEEHFFLQVKSRVPALLLILVRQLTVSLSSRVRIEGAALMETILKLRSRWGSHAELVAAAYESILSLSLDPDGEVMEVAKRVLGDAPDELLPASKIVELISELVPLAHRQSLSQLQAKLRLLSAIVSRVGKTNTRTLRLLLASPDSGLQVQASLVAVFDLEIASHRETTSHALIQVLDHSNSPATPMSPQLRYLDDESRVLAIAFVEALGRLVGGRSVAVLVDSMVARLFQACDSRARSKSSLTGQSHAQWLHEWIGTVPVVHHLLRGAFQKGPKTPKLLTDVNSSLLPLLMSEAFMTLPCQEVQEVDVDEESMETRRLRHSADTLSSRPFLRTDVASSVIQGNLALISSLLDLVGLLAELQGSSFRRFLPVCLYPVLEKSIHSIPVYGAARSTLDRLAFTCAYESRFDMISDNIGSLVGTVMARLRVPGGRSLKGAAGLDDAVLDTATTLTMILQWLASSSTRSISSPALSSLQVVVKELMMRFDHSSTRLIAHPEKMIRFVRLFEAALLLLLKDCPPSPSFEDDAQDEPWLHLLEPFEIHPDTPEDGFARLWEQKEGEKGDALPALEGSSSFDRDQLTLNTHFVDQLLSRCCYALTSPNLPVQLGGVDALIHGFSYLGWIAAAVRRDSEEFNGPTTAILRQVHATWTALASRLDAVTSAVTFSATEGRSSLLLVSAVAAAATDARRPPQGESRLLLAQMVRLLTVMTECAGDFLAPRLRASVWPQLTRVLQMFLERLPWNGNPAFFSATSSRASVAPFTDSERALLLSVLGFFERIYRCREVGAALASLIPAAGVLLLPLAGHPFDPIVAAASRRALESLLRVDGDALWRPLTELSGRPCPPCPLRFPGWQPPVGSASASPPSGTVLATCYSPADPMARAAAGLLDFLLGLPEQVID